MRLRAGRLFSAEEEAEGREVALVSDDVAERLWGRSEAVGRRLRIEAGPWLRVVGVLGQTREGGDMLLLDTKPASQIYVPYRRDAPRAVSLVLRVRSQPLELSAALREAVCEGCRWLGLELDRARNRAGGPRISAEGSSVAAWVIPTDEERMIARHTLRVLGLG